MSAPALSSTLSRRTRWPVPVTLAVLMHLTAIVLLWSAWRATNDTQPALAPMIVRWLTAPVAQQEEAEAPKSAPAELRRVEQRATSRNRSAHTTPSDLPPVINHPAEAPVEVPAAPSPVEETGKKPLKLDPDTIARAARDVVHNPSLSRQSDEIVGKTEAPTKQEVLAARVAQSAKKDCLKGDYEGKNDGSYKPRLGGLFEIPFLVADVVTGRCRN